MCLGAGTGGEGCRFGPVAVLVVVVGSLMGGRTGIPRPGRFGSLGRLATRACTLEGFVRGGRQ